MPLTSFEEDLQDLSSAEEFLDYFEVPYDPKTVHVNRLHILQRFHDYLAQSRELLPEGHDALRAVYKRLLAQAYQDFVVSDALTEKVFKVFHDAQDAAFVPIESIGRIPTAPGEGG
ncbi:MAG: nitrogenase-stabilizing/protective protein NifW [Isosphaeraceae bacterium]|nr:nitrogenase-stabilizing/protective protein NifW [Isosphaeraceae bacterium]